MNVKDAAKRLEISQSLLYQLIAEGRMPHRRIGGRGRRGKIVLKDEDIKEFENSVRMSNNN